MTPEEWCSKKIEYVVGATEVELTADDQKELHALLSSNNGVVVRALIGAMLKSTPSAAVILQQDLSSPGGVQKAQRLQGKILGVNGFIECLFEFASGAIGEKEDAA